MERSELTKEPQGCLKDAFGFLRRFGRGGCLSRVFGYGVVFLAPGNQERDQLDLKLRKSEAECSNKDGEGGQGGGPKLEAAAAAP